MAPPASILPITCPMGLRINCVVAQGHTRLRLSIGSLVRTLAGVQKLTTLGGFCSYYLVAAAHDMKDASDLLKQYWKSHQTRGPLLPFRSEAPESNEDDQRFRLGFFSLGSIPERPPFYSHSAMLACSRTEWEKRRNVLIFFRLLAWVSLISDLP